MTSEENQSKSQQDAPSAVTNDLVIWCLAVAAFEFLFIGMVILAQPYIQRASEIFEGIAQ